MVFSVVPNELTALLALLLPLVFAITCLRSTIVAIVLGVPVAWALWGVVLGGSLIGTAQIISTVFIIGLGAAAILHLKPWVSALLGVAAYGIALALTKDPLSATRALQFVPCATLLAFLMARKVKRVTAVYSVSIAFLVTCAIPFLFQLYGEYGTLSEATFNSLLTSVRTAYLQVYTESIHLLPEEMQALATEDLFHTVFDAVLCLLPAFLVIIGNLLAFFAHSLSFCFCRKTGYANRFPLHSRLFVMSKVSAILYIVSLLLPILGLGNSHDAKIITLTAENINLMLMPAFLLVGSIATLNFFRRNRGCLNIWVLLALAFLLLYSGGILLYPLALIGAFHTLRTSDRKIGDA